MRHHGGIWCVYFMRDADEEREKEWRAEAMCFFQRGAFLIVNDF